MNNIYIFGITSASGGIENLMRYFILDSMKKNMFQKVFIVTSYNTIAFEQEYLDNGTNIIKIPQRKNRKNYKNALNNIVNNISPKDIIYLNISTYCNWTLFNTIKKCNCRVVIHGHNAKVSNPLKKILHYIGKKRFSKLGRKIAVSSECSRFMFGNKSNAIIHNGINSNDFLFNKNDRDFIRNELSIDKNAVVVGCVGRISKEKNQLYLSKISKKYPDLLFLFVGDFMNKKYKAKMISNSESNCIFVGQKNNVGMYLSAMDGLVLPSKSEAFPLSAAEALSNSLPIFCHPKLTKKLPEVFVSNRDCHIMLKNELDVSVLKESHNKRTIGITEQNNSFDITIFLKELYLFLGEF